MSSQIKDRGRTTEPVPDNENHSAQAETVLDDSADASEGKNVSSQEASSLTRDDAATKARQRQERFKALQARAVSYCETLPRRLLPTNLGLFGTDCLSRKAQLSGI